MGLGEFVFWPFVATIGGLMFIVWIAVVAFWIWMIVDAAKRTFKNDAEKIIWIIVIVLANWLGALVYFIVVRQYNPKGLMRQ